MSKIRKKNNQPAEYSRLVSIAKLLGITVNKISVSAGINSVSAYANRSSSFGLKVLNRLSDTYNINRDFLENGTAPVFLHGAKAKIEKVLNIDVPDDFETSGTTLDGVPLFAGEVGTTSSVPNNAVPIEAELLDSLKSIPIYDVPVHALIGVGVNYEDLPVSYKEMDIGVPNRKNLVGFRVFGDSMVGENIVNGSYILVDTKQEPFKNCKVVANHNGVLIVKRYSDDGSNKYKLFSNYNGYEEEYIVGEDDNIQIIGVLKATLTYM